MRTRFVLVPCAIVLMLPRAALAAEDAIGRTGVTPGVEPQLILLHQPPRRVVQASPEKALANILAIQVTLARRHYAQFFVDRRVTEPQVDALTRLVAEHSTLTEGWVIGDGVQVMPQETAHQRAREVLLQIEQFLGPSAFQEFEEYRDTMAERFQLNRLVRLLVAVGRPLTSEQSSQLVSIMRAERGGRQELWPNSDEFDRRIKPRFAAVLSAEQREFAERYFAGRAERRHSALGPSRPAD